MPITNTQADNAKPQATLYRLNDGNGLQLEIRPTGRKFWIYRYRHPGTKKPTVYTMGEYPQVSIKRARAVLLEAKALISDGVDPNTQKQRDRMRGQGETFLDVAREWYEKRLPKWTPANAEQTWKSLELDVLPHIGGRIITKLEPPDLLLVIRRIEGRGALNKAEKVLARLRSIFTYAVDTGKVKYNPTPSAGAMQSRPEGKHFNALTRAELPACKTPRRSPSHTSLPTVPARHCEAYRQAHHHAGATAQRPETGAPQASSKETRQGQTPPPATQAKANAPHLTSGRVNCRTP